MRQTSAAHALCALIIGLFLTVTASAAQTDIAGPASSGLFGTNVTVLPNGNIVVTDPTFDLSGPTVTDVGAVYLYDGATLALISTLTGSTANDTIGSGGITVLTNGNYVISSSNWNNPSPSIINVGAATWCSATTGCSGTVSAANSLIGSSLNDNVSNNGITALPNGNYVVTSSFWDNPFLAMSGVGAATWGNGNGGTVGLVSASNSLVGGTAGDAVGSQVVTALTNGNYVVPTSSWDNPSPLIANVGAATWGNGNGGTVGLVTNANSLVGGTVNNFVGTNGVTALTNGNYVVSSPNWDNPSPLIGDVGAATWGNGAGGTVGLVTAANPLIGGTVSDLVGNTAVTALTNGNYVVNTPNWDNPSPLVTEVGAVTWGNGNGGTVGTVTAANSLIGGTANDQVGNIAVVPLNNGNYIFRSNAWDNPSPSVSNATAYTFGNGNGGTNGLVSSANSVVGTVSSGTNVAVFDATRNRLVVGRQASNLFSILFFNTTAVADGDISNAANWSSGAPDGLLTGIIPTGRTMSISSVINAGLIQVQCGGNLTGGGASAYIVGSVRRDYCAASNESFTYPIGDANNYSPLNVSNTNGTGALTAAVTDNYFTGLAQTNSISRLWSLTGAGITTDLTFNYVNADVNGTEADYRIFKRNANNNVNVPISPSVVNPAANTISTINVANFSDWGAGRDPAPALAAGVTVSGRVMTKDGNGIRNVIVSLTDANGITRSVRTSSFGYYSFDEVEVDGTYIVAVQSKRFQFAPQVVSVTENVEDLNFITTP